MSRKELDKFINRLCLLCSWLASSFCREIQVTNLNGCHGLHLVQRPWGVSFLTSSSKEDTVELPWLLASTEKSYQSYFLIFQICKSFNLLHREPFPVCHTLKKCMNLLHKQCYNKKNIVKGKIHPKFYSLTCQLFSFFLVPFHSLSTWHGLYD